MSVHFHTQLGSRGFGLVCVFGVGRGRRGGWIVAAITMETVIAEKMWKGATNGKPLFIKRKSKTKLAPHTLFLRGI